MIFTSERGPVATVSTTRTSSDGRRRSRAEAVSSNTTRILVETATEARSHGPRRARERWSRISLPRTPVWESPISAVGFARADLYGKGGVDRGHESRPRDARPCRWNLDRDGLASAPAGPHAARTCRVRPYRGRSVCPDALDDGRP